MRAYLALFDEDGTPKETFASQLRKKSVSGVNSIFYIEEVQLEKKYRGYGLGLLAVDGVIASYFADFVVLFPEGLAQETGINAILLGLAILPNNVLSAAHRQATQQKLIPCWRCLGLRHMGTRMC